jgi:hypothetical protein
VARLSRLFAVCPRISKGQGQLVATTAWRLRLLSLGSHCRRVVVDLRRKTLVIERTYFWAVSRRRRIPFQTIEAVTYGYQDWAFPFIWNWTHDTVDLFTVGVRVSGGDEVHLCSFFGEGTFSNAGPLPDWLYWEDFVFDISGTQEQESRTFVELLSKLMGAPVIPA